VFDDSQRGGGLERHFRLRRHVTGKEARYKRHTGEVRPFDQFRVDANPARPGQAE